MSLPNNIKARRLGLNGPLVSSLGFGLMGISAFYGPHGPDSERFALLDRAYDIGQRFWDTADMHGDSEDRFVGNPEKREHVFLATKFGITGSSQDGGIGKRGDPEYVRGACERSLKRLGVEWIDLFYAHRVDGVTPVEKKVEAMVELRRYIFAAFASCMIVSKFFFPSLSSIPLPETSLFFYLSHFQNHIYNLKKCIKKPYEE